MKNILLFSFLFLSLLIVSCNKDDDKSDYFNAKIDGTDFNTSSMQIIVDTTFGLPILINQNTDTNLGYTITILVPYEDFETGTFPIDETDIAVGLEDTDENSFTTVGELVITENDQDNNVIEGTFSFTATSDDADPGVVEVSDGEFRITYEE